MKFLIGFLLILTLCGCKESNDTMHPVYYLAAQCIENGDYEAAQTQLRRFLRMRPNSSDGHLAIASLYDENLNNPLSAIYHYQEYLRVAPESDEKVMAKAWLNSAIKRYQESLLPEEIVTTNQSTEKNSKDKEISRLEQKNQALLNLIVRQRKEINRLSSDFKTAPASDPEIIGISPKTAQTYSVQAGDTLGRIARRFYGASSKFNLIMAANKLTNTRLSVGQQLIIPVEK